MDGNDSARPPKEAPLNPPEDRLDSWKEIAAYLRRDESTVRRWQKEGLPVHRHHHKFRAAVFAYKSELDAWWNTAERETVDIPADDPIASGTPGPPRPGPAEHAGGAASRFPARLAALLVAVIAGGAVAWWAWQQHARAAVVPRNLVLAVLPLQNLSGDPNEEYFSDGLTEELITQLSRLQPDHLAVIARTSTMQYKGTAKRVDAIGRELGADFLLEGSVRRAGG
jgi:hypothetical protein